MDSVTYWTKQILPEGSFTHQTFTPQVLARAIAMFDPAQGVPFTLGDVQDATTTAKAGTLTGLTYYPGEGILGNFELTDEAARHVEKYPRFGVTTALSQDGRIQAIIGTNTPQIPDMVGWEKVTPTSTEEESEYEEVSRDLSEPEPEARPQLNQQNRGSNVSSEREQLIGELKQHGIDVSTSTTGPVTDDLLEYLAQHCRSGYVNKARSEFHNGFAQHRLRVKNSGGTPAPQQTTDLSYPANPQEGNTVSNNLDPNMLLRLEEFVSRSLGVSATGMRQQEVVDLATQARVGREQEYMEAVTGQEYIDSKVAHPDEMRAWMDTHL